MPVKSAADIEADVNRMSNPGLRGGQGGQGDKGPTGSSRYHDPATAPSEKIRTDLDIVQGWLKDPKKREGVEKLVQKVVEGMGEGEEMNPEQQSVAEALSEAGGVVDESTSEEVEGERKKTSKGFNPDAMKYAAGAGVGFAGITAASVYALSSLHYSNLYNNRYGKLAKPLAKLAKFVAEKTPGINHKMVMEIVDSRKWAASSEGKAAAQRGYKEYINRLLSDGKGNPLSAADRAEKVQRIFGKGANLPTFEDVMGYNPDELSRSKMPSHRELTSRTGTTGGGGRIASIPDTELVDTGKVYPEGHDKAGEAIMEEPEGKFKKKTPSGKDPAFKRLGRESFKINARRAIYGFLDRALPERLGGSTYQIRLPGKVPTDTETGKPDTKWKMKQYGGPKVVTPAGKGGPGVLKGKVGIFSAINDDSRLNTELTHEQRKVRTHLNRKKAAALLDDFTYKSGPLKGQTIVRPVTIGSGKIELGSRAEAYEAATGEAKKKFGSWASEEAYKSGVRAREAKAAEIGEVKAKTKAANQRWAGREPTAQQLADQQTARRTGGGIRDPNIRFHPGQGLAGGGAPGGTGAQPARFGGGFGRKDPMGSMEWLMKTGDSWPIMKNIGRNHPDILRAELAHHERYLEENPSDRRTQRGREASRRIHEIKTQNLIEKNQEKLDSLRKEHYSPESIKKQEARIANEKKKIGSAPDAESSRTKAEVKQLERDLSRSRAIAKNLKVGAGLALGITGMDVALSSPQHVMEAGEEARRYPERAPGVRGDETWLESAAKWAEPVGKSLLIDAPLAFSDLAQAGLGWLSGGETSKDYDPERAVLASGFEKMIGHPQAEARLRDRARSGLLGEDMAIQKDLRYDPSGRLRPQSDYSRQRQEIVDHISRQNVSPEESRRQFLELDAIAQKRDPQVTWRQALPGGMFHDEMKAGTIRKKIAEMYGRGGVHGGVYVEPQAPPAPNQGPDPQPKGWQPPPRAEAGPPVPPDWRPGVPEGGFDPNLSRIQAPTGPASGGMAGPMAPAVDPLMVPQMPHDLHRLGQGVRYA